MNLKHAAATALFVLAILKVGAQNSGNRGQLRVFLYPTAVIGGDLSMGAEHFLGERFSHELSFNCRFKALPHSWYIYDEGYRVNYQVKYELFQKEIFRFSGGVSLDHWHSWFSNRIIEYHYMTDLSEYLGIYGVTIQSRRWATYSIGLVLSPAFRFGKSFILGADLIAGYGRSIHERKVNEVLYFDQNLLKTSPQSLPISYSHSYFTFIPFLRVKIGYIIG